MTRSPQQYAKVLYAFTKDADKKQLDERVRAFLALVKKEQTFKKMPLILSAFETYAKEQEGIIMADITLARDFSARQLKQILATVGDEVEATRTIDPELIGGIIVRTKNMILDGSLKTQLKMLQQHMATSAQ